MSRPLSAAGSVCAWIGVQKRKPASAIPCDSDGTRGKVLKAREVRCSSLIFLVISWVRYQLGLAFGPGKGQNLAIGGFSAGTCQANPDISVTARRRSVAQQLSRRTRIPIHFRVLPNLPESFGLFHSP